MSEEAEALIEKVLQDEWAETPIDWDNVRFNSEIPEPFIRMQVEWTDSFSVGPGRTRNEGYILLSVFVPLDVGTKTAAIYTDMLNAIYQDNSVGHLHILPGRPERVGTREGWFQRNLLIPFFYDECR